MYFRLAWRNIWRNPRRTTVMLMAITIAVWSMIISGALFRGITDQMVRNGVATLTGHVQVHQRGFRNDPAIENSIMDPDRVEDVLKNRLPDGALCSRRVRLPAIASNARHAEGVILVGIDPEREKAISFIARSVSEGSYLRPGDEYGIIVGQALMERLETRVGRKLILMSQGKDKEIASRAFRISGVFRAEMQATERQFVFVTLPAAQEMLKMKEGISEMCALLPDRAMVDAAAASLRARLPAADYEVHRWQDLLPMVMASLKLYDAIVYVWYVIAFIAMGFGIVNTTLMAVLERTREFGLLRALGMKPAAILKEVLTESFLLLLIGITLGNLLGLLTVFALSFRGIDLSFMVAGLQAFGFPRVIFPVLLLPDAVVANLVVFILGLVVSAYPALKAARFTPVQALART
jgi:ABC-type lipoprotein release transport system permease subunit